MVEDEGEARAPARVEERLAPEQRLVLVVGVGREKPQHRAGLERPASRRMGRRHDQSSPRRQERRHPGEDARRVRDVLEDREEKNSFKGRLRRERGRSRAEGNIPFVEIPGRKTLPLEPQNLRIAVTTGVRRETARKIRQAAADVENPRADGHVRQRGSETGRPDTLREPAIEG